MPSRAEELDYIKRLDLRIVAGEFGYTLNSKRSSRGSAVMDHPSGDRILIAVAPDGHYVWCSVHEQAGGTCIDLWQRHRGGSLGEVRAALRPFLGGPGSVPEGTPPLPSDRAQKSTLPELRPLARDVLGVRARYETFRPMDGHHPYLCEERKLPREILVLPRFADRLRVDERGNAVFPHFNEDGLCGWEARNRGFVSFAAGGIKGLWCSVPAKDDDRLVIAESAIDALSYAAITGDGRARFVSFSGGMNASQPALLGRAMARMPAGSVIIAAVDNDEAGDGYLVRLEQVFAEVGRDDLRYVMDRPTARGSDWNDALRIGSPHPPQQNRAGPP